MPSSETSFRGGGKFGQLFLDYLLEPTFLASRWDWWPTFERYMKEQKELIRVSAKQGKFTDAVGFSPSGSFKCWYEMPTVIQEAVKKITGDPDFFMSQKKVAWFLDRYPIFDLRIRRPR